MMITENVLGLQNWYLKSLERAQEFSHLPIQRDMFKRQALAAEKEFLETYGMELPCKTIKK